MSTYTMLRPYGRRALVPIMLLAVLGLLVALPTGSARADSHNLLVEYPIPGGGSPFKVASQSPGHIWFTLPDRNAIGELVVVAADDFDFTIHAIPTANSEPYDLVYADGFVWFTERAANQIGRLDTSDGSIQEFAVPTANSSPTGIDAAPNGDIWFVERDASRLGRISAGTTTPVEIVHSFATLLAEVVVAHSNTSIWFTGPGSVWVVNYNVSTNEFLGTTTENPVTPDIRYHPTGLTVDSAGEAWISVAEFGFVGRRAPGSLASWRFGSVPTKSAQPSDMTYIDNGNTSLIFVSEPGAGRVLRVLIDNVTTSPINLLEMPLPSTGAVPEGLIVDAEGRVWIADSANGTIVEWRPSYVRFLYLPRVAK